VATEPEVPWLAQRLVQTYGLEQASAAIVIREILRGPLAGQTLGIGVVLRHEEFNNWPNNRGGVEYDLTLDGERQAQLPHPSRPCE